MRFGLKMKSSRLATCAAIRTSVTGDFPNWLNRVAVFVFFMTNNRAFNLSKIKSFLVTFRPNLYWPSVSIPFYKSRNGSHDSDNSHQSFDVLKNIHDFSYKLWVGLTGVPAPLRPLNLITCLSGGH